MWGQVQVRPTSGARSRGRPHEERTMKMFRKALVASAVALGLLGRYRVGAVQQHVRLRRQPERCGYVQAGPAGRNRSASRRIPIRSGRRFVGGRYGLTITPANQGGTNYAQGGARVRNCPGVPPAPPTVAAVPHHDAGVAYVSRGVDPGALHTVWGGANDISISALRRSDRADHGGPSAGERSRRRPRSTCSRWPHCRPRARRTSW